MILIWGNTKNSYGGVQYGIWRTREMCVWRNISAQIGPSVTVQCRDEFATHHVDLYLVVYGQLRQS
jgi:hypothetical protein